MIKDLKILNDISHLSYGQQETIINDYINSLLYGEVKDYLLEKGIKVFKGISRKFTDKYIQKFNKIININNNKVDEIGTPLKYDGLIEYIGFFVFQDGRGNAFLSFPSAYKFSFDMYLFNHMILGNTIKQLSLNTDVFFGKVIINNGKMIFKDVESVVNKNYYLELINS